MEAATNDFIEKFSRWYKKKDLIPALEWMQKLIVFHQNENIDMLKLGCTYQA